VATLSCISVQTIDGGAALAAALTAITGEADPTANHDGSAVIAAEGYGG
jgi:hypothetical protein